MIVGVPKEVKDHETRVGLVPSAVHALREAGHEVIVEAGAGTGSSLPDREYKEAGAELVRDARDLWARAGMVVKVKEPQPSEYEHLRPGLILFTYLHLAPEPELTKRLLCAKVTAIAYETMREEDGSLPLLTPMSEVAGRLAVQIGAVYLEAPNGGRGILLGGVPGVAPGNVLVLGGGVVGTNAAKIAVGMGAHVAIIDRNLDRLRQLDDIFGGRAVTLASNVWTVRESLRHADLVIGGVLIPGASAPRLVRREMLSVMKPASVMVDVQSTRVAASRLRTLPRTPIQSTSWMACCIIAFPICRRRCRTLPPSRSPTPLSRICWKSRIRASNRLATTARRFVPGSILMRAK